MNKQTPKFVDDTTRLDRASAGPGRTFTYHNTITSMRASEVDMTSFRTTLTSQVRAGVCANQLMASMRKAGVTTVYAYHGSDGRSIGTIVVSPSDCAA